MSGDFDPYEQWLGIPRRERPADHYRLLGLTCFESDPAVIRAAADQRIARVRQQAGGPHAESTQRVLNDLAAAKLCLLDATTKAAYDSVLRTRPAPVAAGAGPTPGPPSWQRPLPRAAAAAPATPPARSPAPAPAGGASYGSPPGRSPLAPAVAPELPSEADFRGEEPVHLSTGVLVAIGGILLFVAGMVLTLTVIVLLKRPEPKSPPAPPAPPAIGAVPRPEPERPPPRRPAPAGSDQRPVMVHAEAGGQVTLSASCATLDGGLQCVLRDGDNVLTGWKSPAAAAQWRFKTGEPGIFRAEVTYALTPDVFGGSLTVELDGQPYEHTISLRGGAATMKTDEFYLAIRRKGEHTLVCRTTTPTDQGFLYLRSIRLRPR